MERLLWNVFKELQMQYSCSVVGPKGCRKYISSMHKAFECPIYPLYAFLASSCIKSIRAALTTKPSLCIAGSGLTAPMACAVRQLFKIPMITFVYGLDLVAPSRIYNRLFVPSIRQSDIVIAISLKTAKLAEEKGVASHKIQVLFPGVDIPKYRLTTTDFRNEYKLAGKAILLSVGRLIPRKGLAEFLSNSFPALLKKCPNTCFVIIGSEAKNALKKEGQVLKQIKAIIRERNLTNHVLLLGRVDDVTLNSAYREADLFIFPVRDIPGDMEGFGMVAVEAAAHGLPTVAFAVQGVTDAVAHNISGFLVAPERYEDFTEIVVSYLKGNLTTVTPEGCLSHAKRFSWSNYGKRLREICHQAMQCSVTP